MGLTASATPKRPGADPTEPNGPSDRPGGRRWRGAGIRSTELLVSLSVLAGAVLLSLSVGSVTISWGTTVDALTAFDGSNEHLIVRSLRLPRTVIGLGVGASLAVAGVAMQAITRNALASPTVLGVNAGASFTTDSARSHPRSSPSRRAPTGRTASTSWPKRSGDETRTISCSTTTTPG